MSMLEELYSLKDVRSIDEAAMTIDEFRQTQAKKIFESAWAAPILAYYAWKGKIGTIERGVLFLIALTILYRYYKDSRAPQLLETMQAQVMPIMAPMVQTESVLLNEDEYMGGLA